MQQMWFDKAVSKSNNNKQLLMAFKTYTHNHTYIPYSWNVWRVKTFTNFAVLSESANVLTHGIKGCGQYWSRTHSLIETLSRESFIREILFSCGFVKLTHQTFKLYGTLHNYNTNKLLILIFNVVYFHRYNLSLSSDIIGQKSHYQQ